MFIMKMNQNRQPSLRLNLLCLSLGYIAVGVILLFFPALSLMDLCHALGILCIIWGVISAGVFFIRKQYQRPGHMGFSFGIAAVLLGLYAVCNTIEFERIFTQLLALLIIFDSILKIQFSMDLLRMDSSKWWVVLMIAMATAILAMVILLDPFSVSQTKERYTYLVLITDGIVNIFVVCYLAAVSKAYQKRLPE